MATLPGYYRKLSVPHQELSSPQCFRGENSNKWFLIGSSPRKGFPPRFSRMKSLPVRTPLAKVPHPRLPPLWLMLGPPAIVPYIRGRPPNRIARKSHAHTCRLSFYYMILLYLCCPFHQVPLLSRGHTLYHWSPPKEQVSDRDHQNCEWLACRFLGCMKTIRARWATSIYTLLEGMHGKVPQTVALHLRHHLFAVLADRLLRTIIFIINFCSVTVWAL